MGTIGVILWLMLSWGATSMLLRGRASSARSSTPGGNGTHDQPATKSKRTVRHRVSGWIGLVDARTVESARQRDWGDSSWWWRSLLGAAWAPIMDLRWVAHRVRTRRHDEQRERPNPTPLDDEEQPGPRREQSAPGPGGEKNEPRQERRDSRTGGDVPPFGSHDEDPDIVVEVVGTRPTAPPSPALTPSPRALEPGAEPQPVPAPSDSPTTEQESIVTKYVAIPSSGGVQPTSTGTLAAAGDTHADGKEHARKIVAAITMTGDPVEQAAQMLAASEKAAWEAVDRLQEAGIGGVVLEAWCEAVMAFGIAAKTARELVAQLQEAQDAAAEAARRQAATGDQVADAVAAADRSVARSTAYYR